MGFGGSWKLCGAVYRYGVLCAVYVGKILVLDGRDRFVVNLQFYIFRVKIYNGLYKISTKSDNIFYLFIFS